MRWWDDMRSSKVAQYGLFAALAILMGYVEMLIPLPLLVPGMKLGLANVIIVIVLYHIDTKSAFFIPWSVSSCQDCCSKALRDYCTLWQALSFLWLSWLF